MAEQDDDDVEDNDDDDDDDDDDEVEPPIEPSGKKLHGILPFFSLYSGAGGLRTRRWGKGAPSIARLVALVF